VACSVAWLRDRTGRAGGGGFAAEQGSEDLHLSQAYAITEGGEIGSGTESFSLLRDSDLAPDDYRNTFFSTGGEHIQESSGDDS
jgi:hypothetical protein